MRLESFCAGVDIVQGFGSRYFCKHGFLPVYILDTINSFARVRERSPSGLLIVPVGLKEPCEGALGTVVSTIGDDQYFIGGISGSARGVIKDAIDYEREIVLPLMYRMEDVDRNKYLHFPQNGVGPEQNWQIARFMALREQKE